MSTPRCMRICQASSLFLFPPRGLLPLLRAIPARVTAPLLVASGLNYSNEPIQQYFCNAQGGTLRRAQYGASAWSAGLDYGASYGCSSDDPALIVTRATEAAKFGEGASGWSGYSLLTNNCETFAYWCSTGRRVCYHPPYFSMPGMEGAVSPEW